MPEFLLEIGCEEIPAGWLPGVTTELRERFTALAAAEHLDPCDVASFSTPRRLVLRAEIRDRQPDREELVWGPSLKVARDAVGKWTKAAEGFARKTGVEPSKLRIAMKGPDGPADPPAGTDPAQQNLLFVKAIGGEPAAKVLGGVMAATLRGLTFPKRMSWDAWLDDGKGAFPFGRPIRWLVALLDGAVVLFQIRALVDGGAGPVVVEAGGESRGHRFLPRENPGQPFPVRSFAELKETLAVHGVRLDREERLAAIRAALEPVAKEIRDDHGLVEDWAELVEWPSVVFGTVPPEFRSLPREVLETVLVHHQKYIPLVDGANQVSRFAAVTNIDGAGNAEIVRGMERVVVARLRDGAFFFEEDRKRPLAERVSDLAGVTFHQKLGSYEEKAGRLVRLVDAMTREMFLLSEEERQAAGTAARLAKADLTTLMVREFTELQGAMGGIYLRAEGAAEDVATAVYWHYHPLSVAEGDLPVGRIREGAPMRVFAAVSLADKMDTLAGYFGLGLVPTGSSDPYGLRRAAQGVVRILIELWEPGEGGRPSLRQLVAAALQGYEGVVKRSLTDAGLDLEVFLLDRLRYVLGTRGFPADEVEAALGAREPDTLEDPHETLVRLRALHAVRQEVPEDFEHLAAAFKRAANIRGTGGGVEQVDPALLTEPAEKALHATVAALEGQGGDYAARLRALAGLRAPVDRFFEDVLVMHEDPRIRSNRLGLLRQALSLFYRVADISRLGG
jgi:glycyl-tRNA synthetase beta chain